MRALIIEDDESNRKILSAFLTPLGTCDTAADGEEGLTKFAESFNQQIYYDLVCIDVMMPGIDGVTVLKRLREYEAQNESATVTRSKVLMITAVSDKEVVINSFKEGCQGYLIKPLNRDELFRQLKLLKLVS